MSSNERSSSYRLLETGVAVPFRLVSQEIEPALDEAEFGVRLELKFEAAEDEDDEDPEDIVEWGAFGFLFAIALLAFDDARPRESSILEYQEKDELTVSDFVDCLAFRRGSLEFRADYLRGRRMKLDITVRPDGSVTLRTIGRGKTPLRWIDRIQGKKVLSLVEKE